MTENASRPSNIIAQHEKLLEALVKSPSTKVLEDILNEFEEWWTTEVGDSLVYHPFYEWAQFAWLACALHQETKALERAVLQPQVTEEPLQLAPTAYHMLDNELVTLRKRVLSDFERIRLLEEQLAQLRARQVAQPPDVDLLGTDASASTGANANWSLDKLEAWLKHRDSHGNWPYLDIGERRALKHGWSAGYDAATAY
jgi:hypothetical protein